jgi:tetratricopeptide (TPR) repeat protein
MSFFSFLFGRSRRRAAAEHAGQGNALAERGEFDDALKEYDEAHRLDPGAANVRSRRAGVYFNTGRHDDALAEAEEALCLDPGQVLAHYVKAAVRDVRGEHDRAIDDFSAVIRLAPGNALARVSRAWSLAARGEYARAVEDLEVALRLDPENAVAHNNLAWLLATCPRDEVRCGARAVKEARAACELTGWKEAYCLGVLAAAYAEVGDFGVAVSWHKKALGLPKYVEEFGERVLDRLKLYEEGKPYREEWGATL